MSRLRRWFVADKFFFVTCNVRRTRTAFTEPEFAILAKVFDRVRERRGFLLAGYVFMPDHWHGLIFPASGDTLPRLMGALKIASSRDINRSRQTHGEFCQLRYYDHAIRTVKECQDTLRYMHFNPVSKGLVKRPEDWPWSSFHSYGGPGPIRLRVDLVDLTLEESTPL